MKNIKNLIFKIARKNYKLTLGKILKFQRKFYILRVVNCFVLIIRTEVGSKKNSSRYFRTNFVIFSNIEKCLELKKMLCI